MSNKSLNARIGNVCDEYYTTRASIEDEMKHWAEFFRGKRVCCPCDSEESEFVKFFRDNAERLGIRSFEHYGYNYKKNRWEFGTMYGPASYYLQESYNDKPEGVNDIQKGMIASCDIVVTNPPFSLIVEFYRYFKHKYFIMVAPVSIVTRKGVYEDIKKIWAGYTKPKCAGMYSINNIMWLQNVGNVSRETPFKNLHFEPDGFLDEPHVPNFNRASRAPTSYNGIFAVPISAFEKLGAQDIEVVDIVGKSAKYPEGATVDGVKIFWRLLVKYKEV